MLKYLFPFIWMPLLQAQSAFPLILTDGATLEDARVLASFPDGRFLAGGTQNYAFATNDSSGGVFLSFHAENGETLWQKVIKRKLNVANHHQFYELNKAVAIGSFFYLQIDSLLMNFGAPSACRYKNHNVLKVDAQGQILWTISLPQGPLDCNDVYDQMLVGPSGDKLFLAQNDRLHEVDTTGTILKITTASETIKNMFFTVDGLLVVMPSREQFDANLEAAGTYPSQGEIQTARASDGSYYTLKMDISSLSESDCRLSRFNPDHTLVWERIVNYADRDEPGTVVLSGEVVWVSGTFFDCMNTNTGNFCYGLPSAFVAAFNAGGEALSTSVIGPEIIQSHQEGGYTIVDSGYTHRAKELVIQADGTPLLLSDRSDVFMFGTPFSGVFIQNPIVDLRVDKFDPVLSISNSTMPTDQVFVYPNPAGAEIHFVCTSGTIEAVTVFNAQGNVVNECTSGYLHIGHLPGGVYAYRLKTLENQVYSGSFIKM